LTEKVRTLANFPSRKPKERNARVKPPSAPGDPGFRRMTQRKPTGPEIQPPMVDPDFDVLLGPSEPVHDPLD
jgi:hypothetical protein